MKTRLKELFFGGIGGIFIDLFFSMIVSYFYNPAYLPLFPHLLSATSFEPACPCFPHYAHLPAYLVYHGAFSDGRRKLLQRTTEHPPLDQPHYGVILTFTFGKSAGFSQREKNN